MIEMIFVLGIAMIFVLCSVNAFHGSSHLKIQEVKELLYQAQAASIMNAKEIEVVFDGDTLQIEEEIHDIHPLVCESLIFHYNELGHISSANTLSCFEENREHKLIFQLGSGWIRIE